MSTVSAPGEAARPALALVNSRRYDAGGPIDDLAAPAGPAHVVGRAGLPSDARGDQKGLAAVHELRGAVRELLEARIEARIPDRGAVEIVNDATASAPTARRLIWTDPGTPREERHSRGAGGIPLACALLANDAIDLVTGPAHADLLACGAPGCVRLLLRDHPRRQWCSTRCGDRVRANRYYHRHRESTR